MILDLPTPWFPNNMILSFVLPVIVLIEWFIAQLLNQLRNYYSQKHQQNYPHSCFFSLLYLYIMDNIQDLNESPIEIEGQENYSNYSSEEDQNVQPTDCETFKGSFLLEMEKMSKPLTFEKMPYSIYSLEYDEYQEHVLCFMQEQVRQTEIDFRSEIKEQQLESYVLDFGQNALTECICNCHQRSNRMIAPTTIEQIKEKQKTGNSVRSESKQSEQKNEPKRKRSQFEQRKWTSISLKQYKQQIKKKLQQKR